MKFLSIDLGDQRTGLAVGEEEFALVTPLEVLAIPAAQEARLIEALRAAAVKHAPDALVIGLPLNMDDDSEGPAAKKCRALGDRIATALNLPVHYQDERLTSADAEWQLAGSGLTHKQKKEKRDALAAATILRDFFARRSSS